MHDDGDEFGFQWHITDHCNRRCRHCYQERFDSGREPSIDSLISLTHAIFPPLAPLPVTVNVTGGEPLLVAGIERFLAALASHGNCCGISIITNGTIANEALLDRIGAAAPISAFKVSLESDIPRVNDAIRGRGHLACLTRTIPLLRARAPVVLMVTLARYNVNAVSGICALARRLGAEGVVFERYVPLGQGAALRDRMLDSAGWSRAITLCAREAGVDHEPGELLPYRAFWVVTGNRDNDDTLRGALCNLGAGSMALMPDGTVFPCRRLPLPVGRLPADSMTAVREQLRRYDPRTLPSHLRPAQCNGCSERDGCAGCRALARACSGSLQGDDPQCARFAVAAEDPGATDGATPAKGDREPGR